MPGALLVVLLGLLIAVIQYPSVLRTLRFGPSMPHVVWPTWVEWKKGGVPLEASWNAACNIGSLYLGIPDLKCCAKTIEQSVVFHS